MNYFRIFTTFLLALLVGFGPVATLAGCAPTNNYVAAFKGPQIDVKNYGATGNGSTDDTAAIQGAIDAAIAAGGGEVLFPTGTYRVSSLTMTNALGVRLKGVSKFGTKLLCSNLTANMLTLTDTTLCEIQDFEIYLTGQKTAGSFILLDDAQITRIRNVRMQSPYLGLNITNNSSGMFSEMDFVPQNSSWPWNSAIKMQSSAGLVFHSINVNYGTCTMQNAAIWIDSGVDTAIFSNIGANQIGGTGMPITTGGKSFQITHTLSPGSFAPRWIKVVNGLFEGGSDVGIRIEAGNNVEFTNAYSVSSKSGVSITGGSNIKFYGGTFAAHAEHGFNITGGSDILIDGATVTACSLLANNTYSGILVDPGAVRVKIRNPIIGDVTTIPSATNVMANGIAIANSSNSNDHSITNPTFGALVTTPVFKGMWKTAYRLRTETEHTSAPAAGTWAVGDTVWNSAPTAGSPIGWRCITAGTPGIWEATAPSLATAQTWAAAQTFSSGVLISTTSSGNSPTSFLGASAANSFYNDNNGQTITSTAGVNVILDNDNNSTTELWRIRKDAANYTAATDVAYISEAGLMNLVPTGSKLGVGFAAAPTEAIEVDGNVMLRAAGNGIKIKTGSNATMGRATLVGGTVTVATTKATSTANIILTTQIPGGTVGAPIIASRVNGTSFTIESREAGALQTLDTSTVSWVIFEEAP